MRPSGRDGLWPLSLGHKSLFSLVLLCVGSLAREDSSRVVRTLVRGVEGSGHGRGVSGPGRSRSPSRPSGALVSTGLTTAWPRAPTAEPAPQQRQDGESPSCGAIRHPEQHPRVRPWPAAPLCPSGGGAS